MKPSF